MRKTTDSERERKQDRPWSCFLLSASIFFQLLPIRSERPPAAAARPERRSPVGFFSNNPPFLHGCSEHISWKCPNYSDRRWWHLCHSFSFSWPRRLFSQHIHLLWIMSRTDILLALMSQCQIKNNWIVKGKAPRFDHIVVVVKILSS